MSIELNDGDGILATTLREPAIELIGINGQAPVIRATNSAAPDVMVSRS
jgi:hypothetical protein